MTPGYETVTLVVRGNDCQAGPPKPAEDIVKFYSELTDAAQRKGHTVSFNSMSSYSQRKGEKLQEKIHSVNASLVATSNDKQGITFVDMTHTFHLADGSINDGYNARWSSYNKNCNEKNGC